VTFHRSRLPPLSLPNAVAPAPLQVGAELLVDHGFLEPKLPASALLFFALDVESDSNIEEKLDCLEYHAGLSEAQPWILSEEQCAAEGLPSDLLAFLRLKHLRGSEAFLLESVFADSLWTEHLQLPVSKENEAAALGDVGGRVDGALQSMAGSLQSDLRTLGEDPLDSRAYMLAAVRYAERRALEAASRWVEAQLLSLDSLQYYQERRLASLGLQPVEEDELDALRAAGRQYSTNDIEW